MYQNGIAFRKKTCYIENVNKWKAPAEANRLPQGNAETASGANQRPQSSNERSGAYAGGAAYR